MTAGDRSLPVDAREYARTHPTATPTEVLDESNCGEAYREAVEHFCAVTRYFRFGGDEGCEIPSGVKPTNVEWSDVADWDVSDPEEGDE